MNRKQYSSIVVLALFGGLVGGAVSSQFLVGQSVFAEKTPMTVIEANQFRLVDEEGKTRAALLMTDGSPALVLSDRNSQAKAFFMMNPDGSSMLSMHDKNGQLRTELLVQSDGSPLFELHDGNGKTRASIFVDSDGIPMLKLHDKNELASTLLSMKPDGSPALFLQHNNRAALLALEGGPALILTENDGLLRAGLTMAPDGSPGLMLADRNGKPGILLHLDAQGSPSAYFAHKGDLLWSAPPRSGIYAVPFDAWVPVYLNDTLGMYHSSYQLDFRQRVVDGKVKFTARGMYFDDEIGRDWHQEIGSQVRSRIAAKCKIWNAEGYPISVDDFEVRIDRLR